jgi:hypothetical protein
LVADRGTILRIDCRSNIDIPPCQTTSKYLVHSLLPVPNDLPVTFTLEVFDSVIPSNRSRYPTVKSKLGSRRKSLHDVIRKKISWWLDYFLVTDHNTFRWSHLWGLCILNNIWLPCGSYFPFPAFELVTFLLFLRQPIIRLSILYAFLTFPSPFIPLKILRRWACLSHFGLYRLSFVSQISCWDGAFGILHGH